MLLNAEKIKQSTENDIGNIEIFKSIGSTNSYGKEYLCRGGITPSLILAEEQTEGRGRCGRSFFSPSSTGLYMTIVYYADTRPEDATLSTITASVASALAIEELSGKSVDIKWVNDLYIDNKKAGGILCESVFVDGKMGIAVGIGINVSTSEFPKFDNNSPTSIGEVDRNLLAAKIYDNFMRFSSEELALSRLDEYKKRFYLGGREIDIHRADGSVDRATALDIDDRGGLVVRLPDSSIETIRSGEVTIRQA